MKFAKDENYITEHPARGLQKKEKTKEKDKRSPFSKDQLNQIFSAPLYTGCKDAKNGYNTAGNYIPDTTARYWAPLLSLWTGMRMHECLQLEHTDINTEDGIDIIYITTSSAAENDLAYEKRVKNKSSMRYVPIHPELKKFGFLDFVEKQKRHKDTRLFPEITAYKGDLSHSFSKWFNGSFLENTITEKIKHKTVFHSFRHNYRDALRRAKLPLDTVCALGGWSENLGVHAIYGGELDAISLYEDICKISYPTLDLSHLYKT